MSGAVPASLKAIGPLIKHAAQLRQAEPVMAYYTKLYALQQGIALPRDDAAKRWLLATMAEVEAEKRALGPLLEQDGMGREYVERFALRVFAIADDEDRAGNAGRGTAQSFFASAVFLDVLTQFGPLQDDLLEKQRYARWKAADISKCLKAGVRPKPGPPGAEDADEDAALMDELRRLDDAPQQPPPTAAAAAAAFPEPPTQQPTQQQQQQPPADDGFPAFPSVPHAVDDDDVPTFPSVPQPKPQQPPPPQQPKPKPQQPPPPPTQQQRPSVPAAAAPAPVVDTSDLGSAVVDLGKMQDAQKHCKYAASALNFEDVPTAVKNLLLALFDLTGKEYAPKH